MGEGTGWGRCLVALRNEVSHAVGVGARARLELRAWGILGRWSRVASRAADLDAYESKRDLAAELLESVRQMKAGKTRVVHSPAVEARERTGLSQSQFAALLGVSVRTLQGWEQGRKQPSGAARTLLNIARTNPKALLDVAGK